MERARQRKTLETDRGLFLVRAKDKARPPRVVVFADPDKEHQLSPDHRDAVLWQPDTCLVVRATAPGRLCIEVTPSHSMSPFFDAMPCRRRLHWSFLNHRLRAFG